MAMNVISKEGIPVIDVKGLSENEDDLKRFATQIYKAFTEIGFVAITNHNISEEKVKKSWDSVKEFNNLPKDVKMKYREDTKKQKFGWSPVGAQFLYNPGDEIPPIADLREALSVIPARFDWPSEVPQLKETTNAVAKEMFNLGQYVLKLMAMALGFEDLEYFSKSHALFTPDDSNVICFATYPPVPEGGLVKGQMRCGEHTDWGSITLLIQDESGGLEIQRTDGSWIVTKPQPNTVIVNVADFMQRWTSDVFISTNHRVREPTDETLKRKTRRSLIFFMAPLDNTTVSCVDGSNKYPPINAAEYLWQRAAQHLG